MAKWNNPSAPDAALAWYRDNTTIISACGTQPTSAANATAATYALGTLAYGTANWTIAAGDAGGARKITSAAATIVVGYSGTVNHIAFTNTGTLCVVGTCAPTAVTAGGTIIVAAFDVVEVGTIT
jgi:hypothetical protein